MARGIKTLKVDEKSHLVTGTKITISNALCRAAHNLSLPEKRIVMIAVSKLDSRNKLPEGMTMLSTIIAKDYAETFCLDANTAYEQLKKGARDLYLRSITFFEEDINIVTIRWISRAKYYETEGRVDIRWTPEVIPHLTNLSREFTTYQLQQASALRSIYSWRLLELLMAFSDTNWAEYTIDEFNNAMEANAKTRENFAAVRRNIIEPAVKELIEKDGWNITWKAIKAGRRVKALRFDFNTKQPRPTKPPAPKAITSPVSPAAQPPAFVPTKPQQRTAEQRAKAREALEAAIKATRGKSE
jgi:plasmid replication initiation protein